MAEQPVSTVLELILSRRSVREGYRDERVPLDLLEQIVSAGLSAPSSKNAQPWRLHVVQDRMILATAAELAQSARGAANYIPRDARTGEALHGYRSTVADSAHVLSSAPTAIFVENLAPFSGGRSALAGMNSQHLSGSLEAYTFEVIGLGAAIENMWLAARALGLAAAFMGDVVVAEQEIGHLLGLKGDLVGALVVGWSDGSPHPPMDDPPMPELPRVVWHPQTDSIELLSDQD